ncbi:MAG: hypothetical protein ABJ171_04730, partial [Halieaceae bacterium]
DNKPDDGNPNDGKDNDPDDGNAGGGNDDDKDSNPDDGNNGGGNDNKPDDGNNGGGNNDDKDSNPDDGNNGGGNDDKDSIPDDGNKGGSSNGKDSIPDDGNNGGGNDDKPDDDNNSNGGSNDDDDDDDDDDDNNGNGKAKGKSAEGKQGLARSTNSTHSLAIVSSNGSVSRISQASLANAAADGEDASTGLRWGRWDDGFESQQVTHWVADSSPERDVVLPQSGTQAYALSGGTAPTDNLGNSGTLNAGSLIADFTNQTVSNELTISIAGDTWQATGQGSISSGAPVFDGSYDVTRDSGATGSGNFSGFFGGNALSSGAPSGAGVGYTLESAATTINGAAAFSASQ